MSKVDILRSNAASLGEDGPNGIRNSLEMAADEISRLTAALAAAEGERDAARGDSTGWREYERVRRKLSEIVSDHYDERSMWPLLARIEIWYKAAEQRAATAEKERDKWKGRAGAAGDIGQMQMERADGLEAQVAGLAGAAESVLKWREIITIAGPEPETDSAYVKALDELDEALAALPDRARRVVAVPAEPTEAMVQAGLDEAGWHVEPYEAPRESGVETECSMSQEDADEINAKLAGEMRDIYRAMLSAAGERDDGTGG